MPPTPCTGKARRGTAGRTAPPDEGAAGAAGLGAMAPHAGGGVAAGPAPLGAVAPRAGAVAGGAADGPADGWTSIVSEDDGRDETTGAASTAAAGDLPGRTTDQTAAATPKEAMAAAIQTRLRPCFGGSGVS